MHHLIVWFIQHPTAIEETTIAETIQIIRTIHPETNYPKKTTVLEEIELDLFTGFEDTTALEDKKSRTVFSAIAVVCCIDKKTVWAEFFL